MRERMLKNKNQQDYFLLTSLYCPAQVSFIREAARQMGTRMHHEWFDIYSVPVKINSSVNVPSIDPGIEAESL